jgi:hypothetical protein
MSKAKPKAKAKAKATTKKSKSKKTEKLELAKNDASDSAAVGHNSNNGQVNEALVELFSEYSDLEENGRAISKAKRDLRARAKEEFGVSSSVFNHEAKLRRMEKDVRIQFEQGCTDLKGMLGYQFALALEEEVHPADNAGDEDSGASVNETEEEAAERIANMH